MYTRRHMGLERGMASFNIKHGVGSNLERSYSYNQPNQ